MNAIFLIGYDMTGRPLIESVVGITCKMFGDDPAAFTDVAQWVSATVMCIDTVAI